MDNIQKMLIGVLSVSGLIALVIPDASTLPGASVDPAPAPVSAVRSPDPAPAPAAAPLAQFDTEPGSSFQSGEPTIDGNPIQPDFGMPIGVSAQADSTSTDSSNNANPDADRGQSNQSGGYTPPVFTMPGSSPAPESTTGTK